MFGLATLALTWLTVGLGLAARTVESASNSPMVLILLPFLGSGFVPADSLPAGLRWFAEYQPLTPVIDTLRGLLAGGQVAPGRLALALGWCAVITVGGVVWSRHLYESRSGRRPG